MRYNRYVTSPLQNAIFHFLRYDTRFSYGGPALIQSVAYGTGSPRRALAAPPESHHGKQKRELLAYLFNEHSDAMVRVAFFVLKSTQDAEDIVHEVFCVLLTGGTETLYSLAPQEQKRYLLTAAHNRALNHLRRTARELLCLDNGYSTEFCCHPDLREDDFTQELCRRNDLALLRKALGSLQKSDREILYAFYFSEKSLAQQAREIGCAAATMRQHLCRARMRFRKKLLSEQARREI